METSGFSLFSRWGLCSADRPLFSRRDPHSADGAVTHATRGCDGRQEGQSAIPEGRYAVVITWSPKFKQWLPVLLGGPDFNHLFKGIRIHAGNTAKDTQGCILVGRNQIVGQVLESRKWLYELKQKIVEAKGRGEAVWLTIK